MRRAARRCHRRCPKQGGRRAPLTASQTVLAQVSHQRPTGPHWRLRVTVRAAPRVHADTPPPFATAPHPEHKRHPPPPTFTAFLADGNPSAPFARLSDQARGKSSTELIRGCADRGDRTI